ncbi:MAG: 4Fe-4S binding protein [Intestinimonas sp.]
MQPELHEMLCLRQKLSHPFYPSETPWLTRTDTCISCGACIYLCPTQARGYRGPVFEVAAKGFEAMCAKRREPELFF